MCRYIMPDQFLGATFSRLISERRYQIDFSTLYKIERKIDGILRERNNAILCFSRNEMYSTIEDYNDFFQIKKDSIMIRESLQKDLSLDHNRQEFIFKLESYFVDGMPIDINRTVIEILAETI